MRRGIGRCVLIGILAGGIFFAAAAVGARGAAGAEKDGILCVAIDSQPPVLGEKERNAVRKGLCSVSGTQSLPEDKQREVESVVLFSLAAGNTDTMDKELELRGAKRLLYSLHSVSGGIVTHTVYLYDKDSKTTVQGGRTFDQPASIKNADRTWAKASASAAVAALESNPLVTWIVAEGGLLGAQIASVMLQPENPAQFLKVRKGYQPEEAAAIRKVINGASGKAPRTGRDLADCALAFLTGQDTEALAAFDRYAKGGPETSMNVMRVNLLLALHRYGDAFGAADAGDRKLGFGMFLFSKSIALYGTGKKAESAKHYEAFKTRLGGDWERLMISVITAAARSGDSETLRVFAGPFLAASPSEAGRDQVRRMMGGT